MGRFFTTRRSEWAPGVAVSGAAIGIAAAIGLSLSIRNWAIYVGLVVAILLLAFWGEQRLRARREKESPRPKSPLKLIRGGKASFDLERDESTDDQKYLM